MVVAGIAAAVAGGCSSNNLIGEQRGNDGSSDDAGSAPIDAGLAESIIINQHDAGSAPIDAGLGESIIINQHDAGSAPIDASATDATGLPGCPITYPATGFYGQNIFYPTVTPFVSLPGPCGAPGYEFAADVPLGSSLTFKFTLLGGTGGDPSIGPIWCYSDSDFRATVYDPVTGGQRGGGLSTGASVGVGTGRPQSGTSEQDRRAMEMELSEKGLPEGKASKPVSGYLYFPVSGKKKHDFLLECNLGTEKPLLLKLVP